MKKHIVPAIMVLFLVIVVAKAIAATVTVNSADFQGTVTTTNTSEVRNGQWIDEDGGVFNGTTSYNFGNNSTTTNYKSGSMASPGFQGTVYLYETRNGTGAVTYRNLRHSGRWYIAPTVRLQGNLIISKPSVTANETVTDNRTAF